MLEPYGQKSKCSKMISTIGLSKCKLAIFRTWRQNCTSLCSVFTSVTAAYYAGFIPLCFVYKHLYYDTLWATQHLAFSFLGYFTMMIAFCFPVKYSDVLHRASLHVGVWTKVTTRSHPPPLLWNKTIIWPFGSYVKYGGEVFRSNSISTCATPSNNSHFRFYVS